MATTDDNIQVICGANEGPYPLAGQTVAEIKANSDLRSVLSVPDDANVRVNGVDVEDTYEVKAGDRVEFYKPSGKKG